MQAAAMGGHLVTAIFLACLVGMAAAGGAAEGRAEVVNTQVLRKIDVSTQFAKVRYCYLYLLASVAASPKACAGAPV